MEQDPKTVLGASIEIEGEIETGEDLVVEGKVSGKIDSKESLSIEKAGRVDATVNTRHLMVGGNMKGDVSATDRVQIDEEGSMVGDIKAPRVLIADGAKFKGNVDMDGPDAE